MDEKERVNVSITVRNLHKSAGRILIKNRVWFVIGEEGSVRMKNVQTKRRVKREKYNGK